MRLRVADREPLAHRDIEILLGSDAGKLKMRFSTPMLVWPSIRRALRPSCRSPIRTAVDDGVGATATPCRESAWRDHGRAWTVEPW